VRNGSIRPDPGPNPRRDRRPAWYSRVARRWRELRSVSPRLATAAAVAAATLVPIDAVLVYERIRYGRELASMAASMTEVERGRVEAIAAAEVSQVAVAAELARRQALGDEDLHLAVDTDRGLLYLQRRGALLREMRVRVGRVATVGTPPDTVVLAPPRGKRSVVQVLDASYPWEIPHWVYADRGWPVPADTRTPGALGPVAVLLDSGAVLYSSPDAGPLKDPGYVLPGNIRGEAHDLEAIRDSLTPGMAVYFH